MPLYLSRFTDMPETRARPIGKPEPTTCPWPPVVLAIGGGGALSSLETTILLTVDETLEVLRKAKQVQYRLPGA